MERQLARKRLIFTVATGRCGTAYLSHLLRFLPGVHSEHEPEPQYFRVLREVQGCPALARRFLAEEKLPAIGESPSRIYAEASHLFCKGFFEPFLELGMAADLILLSRNREAVASSLYRSGTIPGRTEKGLLFYLSPSDPCFVALPDWQRYHDYQLCAWYILEMERRAQVYGERIRRAGGKVVPATLEEIRTVPGFRKLARELGMPGPTPRKWISYWRWGRRKINTIAKEKKDRALPENTAALWEEVERAVEAGEKEEEIH
jgi:hypothetical protein